MRQSRAAFISAGGDPFLLLLMFHFFERNWQHEVDRLYVCFNGNTDQALVGYVQARLTAHPKVTFLYDPRELGYGAPIKLCLDQCVEDVVLLLEDDGFIYHPGVVEQCFRKFDEGYDIVGSPRFSCAFEWSRLMKRKMGVDKWKTEGDTGPNFWPNFFFCRKIDLLKTDLNFAPVSFPKGTYIPALDYTVQEEGFVGDTFTWVSTQLRLLGLKVCEVPQCKASPTEQEDMLRQVNNWAGNPFGWIHGGSLSVFWNGMFIDKYMPQPPNDFCRQEYETRVAFWTMAAQLHTDSALADTRTRYLSQLEKTIDYYSMDRERIHKKILIYKRLLQLT